MNYLQIIIVALFIVVKKWADPPMYTNQGMGKWKWGVVLEAMICSTNAAMCCLITGICSEKWVTRRCLPSMNSKQHVTQTRCGQVASTHLSSTRARSLWGPAAVAHSGADLSLSIWGRTRSALSGPWQHHDNWRNQGQKTHLLNDLHGMGGEQATTQR